MTTMVVIIIPQAIRAVLPALGNEFIVLLKDPSLITVIGGKELLYAAQGIMNRTYEPMFPPVSYTHLEDSGNRRQGVRACHPEEDCYH